MAMEILEKIKDAESLIFVFDSMRTRSHLFFRYLSTSEEVYPIYHPFVLAAYLGPERWPQHSRGSAARTRQIQEDGKKGNPDMTHAKAQAALLEEVAEAKKQGKTPLSGEHIFNVLKQPLLHAMHRDPSIPITHFGDNPTYIPDKIWQTLRPIILIRHPVPHITSGYAALSTLGMSVGIGDEDLEIFCSQRYYRHLFDHLRAQNRTPLVLDADDLLFHTARVTRALTDALDLNASLLSEEWGTMPDEQRPKDAVMRAWMAALHESTGIRRPEREDEKDVEVAYGIWEGRWGGEVAGVLRGLAEENLGCYEYLAGFRV